MKRWEANGYCIVTTKHSDFLLIYFLRIMWTRSGKEVEDFHESFRMKTLNGFLSNFVVKKMELMLCGTFNVSSYWRIEEGV
jgi:hypothetical protein